MSGTENAESEAHDSPGEDPGKKAPLKGLGGIFSLPDSEGYTDSERFLTRLCRASFLRLWSIPNTYRARNKELIDVLLVFGNDVVLFSDKDITVTCGSDLSVSWPRWCRKAIDDSARQLGRAKNWIERFPAQVFLDRGATKPIPVSLPSGADVRYHLVATARGASSACSESMNAQYGSMIVNTAFPQGWSASLPFHVGLVRHKCGLIHVFDELTIELLLNELDTVVDFIDYLKARERFLGGNQVVMATGEEQLLAVYLTNRSSGPNEFLPPTIEYSHAELIQFDDSHAHEFFNGPHYRAKQLANRASYAWDRLIDAFIEVGNPAYVGESDMEAQDVELALRTMAGESRFSRRILVQSLSDFFVASARSSPSKQHFRTVANRDWRGKGYVFFVFPKEEDISYESYREQRKERLSVYCMCLLAKHATLDTVVGLGFDHPLKSYEGRSEDLIVVQQTELSNAERESMLRAAEDLKILGDGLRARNVSFSEYPNSGAAPYDRGARHEKPKKNVKAAKRKRIQSRRSRRGNRR